MGVRLRLCGLRCPFRRGKHMHVGHWGRRRQAYGVVSHALADTRRRENRADRLPSGGGDRVRDHSRDRHVKTIRVGSGFWIRKEEVQAADAVRPGKGPNLCPGPRQAALGRLATVTS